MCTDAANKGNEITSNQVDTNNDLYKKRPQQSYFYHKRLTKLKAYTHNESDSSPSYNYVILYTCQCTK